MPGAKLKRLLEFIGRERRVAGGWERSPAEADWLAAIVESSDDAIVGKDLEGIVTTWNPGAERIFGYTAAEMVGRSITRLIPPDRKEEEKYVLSRIREGKSVDHYETVRVGKNGGLIDISLVVSPIRNADGQIVGAAKVARDISRLKQAQHALHTSEAKFRKLLESNIVGVVFWNLQGQLLDANDRLLSMFGYTREDLSAGILNCHKLTPPEFAEVGDQAMTGLLAKGSCPPFEKECLRKDGSRICVLVGSALIEPQAGLGSSFVMDISERKQAEQSTAQLAEIVHASDDAIVRRDLQGIVQSWNAGAEQTFGYAATEMIGQSMARLLPPELQGEEEEIMDRIRRGKSVRHFETVRVRKDGRPIDVALTVSPIKNGGRKIVGASVVERDITEWKRMEAQLKASRTELRSLANNLRTAREEEAKRISREIHDQLGQALTSLQLDVRALRRALEQPPEQRKPISPIEKLETMSKAIEQTLQMARRVASELRPAMLDELGLAAAIEWQTRQFEERSSIFCNLTLPPTGPELDADRATAVFRIFQEVLTNIARHARATEVAVELRADAEALALEVTDNGVGIKMIEKARRRGHGLVGIQERALAAGIRAQISSQPGHGTKVKIEVPIGAAA